MNENKNGFRNYDESLSDSDSDPEIDLSKVKLDEQTLHEAKIELIKEKSGSDGKFVENLKVAADPKDISDEDRKRNVKKLAGAISHAIRNNGEINVRCFGNAAISKACKALAIAKDYIYETSEPDHKLQLSYSPAFITTQVQTPNGESTLTGICFCTFASENKVEVDFDRVRSVLKVGADAKEIDPQERRLKVRKLAGAISHSVEENKECLVRCFGSSSIGKACKALAIARGFTATRGPDLYCWNDFIMAKMGEKERTGIVFYVFDNSI